MRRILFLDKSETSKKEHQVSLFEKKQMLSPRICRYNLFFLKIY
jgi:hypothetical protein